MAAVVAALPAVTIATASQAHGAEAPTELETVVVTGSRLRRPEFEGPSPVTVVSGEQLEREGFATAYEATQSLTQVTGATQDEQYAIGFAPNASAVDLRGLGPGRVLILVDGRRVTDYPMPYNGESNFVDVSAIPMAAIERIEVLSGGASAIYGSDAVAGVINYILRKDLGNTLDVNVRYGDTSEGGGASQRVQAVGGYARDNFNLTVAAELFKRDPLYGFERDFMDSVQDNPDPALRVNTRSVLRSDLYDLDGDGNAYIDPGAAACAQWPELSYSQRPGFGSYCGRGDTEAGQTIRNGRDRASVYTTASLALERMEVFASVNFFDEDGEYDRQFDYWSPQLSTYIYDVTPEAGSSGYELVQRYILPSEIGGRDVRLVHEDNRVLDYALGLRGDLTGSWRYEATYGHSEYEVRRRARLLLAEPVENYFLGPLLGFDLDPDGFGLPAYDFDPTNLYTRLTPQLYEQLTAVAKDRAESSNDVVSVTLTGDLFEMPAGAVSMAGVLEWGTQEYAIALDPRVMAGDFWSYTGTGGGGERDRYAVGLEFGVPLTETLRASLAGRYDKYDDITQVDDAFSYNLGLEYRPTDQWLLRGSVATSFRAPDMHYVFADPSGYYAEAVDEYWCRSTQPGVPYPACDRSLAAFLGSTQGNPDLEEEEGKSFTLGAVFAPTTELTLSLDYYHIEIDGLVIDYPAQKILQLEADCRLGETVGGAPVDANSALCQNILARVTRFDADATVFSEYLDTVITGPINTATYRTSGLDAKLAWRQDLGAPGALRYELAYTHVLDYEVQNFAGDAFLDYRDDPSTAVYPEVGDFRSKLRGSVSWERGPFTSTVYGQRLGSIPRLDQTGRGGFQTLWNLSFGYSFLGGAANASVYVNNVFDEPPPEDPSYVQYPYFSAQNYDPVGREWFLQLRYKFDY